VNLAEVAIIVISTILALISRAEFTIMFFRFKDMLNSSSLVVAIARDCRYTHTAHRNSRGIGGVIQLYTYV
jgi:hypothetical protein